MFSMWQRAPSRGTGLDANRDVVISKLYRAIVSCISCTGIHSYVRQILHNELKIQGLHRRRNIGNAPVAERLTTDERILPYAVCLLWSFPAQPYLQVQNCTDVGVCSLWILLGAEMLELLCRQRNGHAPEMYGLAQVAHHRRVSSAVVVCFSSRLIQC